ncbi:MAG: SPFH domain-containing protein [Clostridia bacterium]|nr:SPFH domain-containing protein [Clostridia bacterium]NCC44949.1 SPFH domain-containing protein [Clostridia bacterium]
MENTKITNEKLLKPASGMLMFLVSLLLIIGGTVFFVLGIINSTSGPDGNTVDNPALLAASIIVFVIAIITGPILMIGLKIIHPNEALVLTLFGKYYGTLYEPGFFWVVPFCTAINPAAEKAAEAQTNDVLSSFSSGKSSGSSKNVSTKKKVSLKTLTLANEKQKVNDETGNPIEIGTVVIWKVENATKAVLNVEDFYEYLSIQCDAITRNAARHYPYDAVEGSDEKSLRGSSQEIADIMQDELQSKVEDAGIKIIDVRITHLAYAPEIASAMLQRQQASAIIDARQKIVEGAVGMVQMALHQLSENDIVELDEERKAAMVSNLLVVLCGNKDAQPIVNSGSIY